MESKKIDKKVGEAKPVEKKKEPSILDSWDYSEFENNKLKLSNELKTEIANQGLEYRFINKARFSRDGNYHSGAWKPYNTKSRNVVETFAGVDPEGIITRGDLILAVRPKLIGNKFRQRLLEKNARYAAFNKAQAEELRQMAKAAGIGDEVTIHEGYEDN